MTPDPEIGSMEMAGGMVKVGVLCNLIIVIIIVIIIISSLTWEV